MSTNKEKKKTKKRSVIYQLEENIIVWRRYKEGGRFLLKRRNAITMELNYSLLVQ